MSEVCFFLLDGACHELAPGERLPGGAIAVDRMPGDHEVLIDGRWQRNLRAWADAEAGSEHIAEARALKWAEAMLVLAGLVPAQGMLIREAAAKNITVLALANAVVAKRQAFIDAELLRQQRQGS